MKKNVSLKDIAQRVGVSTALVSYVLSGKEKEARVGHEIAAIIRKTAAELNYRPNHLAKSLKTGKSYTIGLIVADISNPFFAHIARDVEDAAKARNYTAIFGSSDENPEKMSGVLDVLIKRQVDGFIIAPTENSEDQIRYLQQIAMPFVLIDRYFPDIDTNRVSTDNHQAAYVATNHLIANGYKRIGLVAYQTALVHMQERERGYRQALAEHVLGHHEPAAVKVDFNYMKRDLQQGLDRLLSAEPPVDALLFATNTLSLEGLKYLDRLNYRIPNDLAVVCFDESDSFDFFYCPITHVRQPLADIAKHAVNVLIDQIENVDRPTEHVAYEAELIIRKSCGG